MILTIFIISGLIIAAIGYWGYSATMEDFNNDERD